MPGYQKYVAIQEFSLNVINNGVTKTLQIKVGDALDFDDINVKISGEDQGTAGSLRKVKGEWIEAYNGSDEFLAQIQDKVRGKAVKPQVLRQVIANSTTEHSSPDGDHDISRKPAPGAHKELKKIVNEPEVAEDPKSKIIHDDQKVVATVTKDVNAAETRSSSSVEISDAGEEKKLEVITDTDTIVVKTTYDEDKSKSSSEQKADDKISIEEDAVIETDYADPKSTDIGSSTKAQIEETPAKATTKTKTKTKKVAVKKSSILAKSEEAINMLDRVIADDKPVTPVDQDGVVVKKTSPIEVEGSIRDIESTLTVGGNDETDGAVTFSSNNEIVDGEATFGGSGEAAPVVISEENAVVVIESDDSIDVSSLLDSL